MSVPTRFRIRGARKEAGLTQQSLANGSGVVVNSVCRWEVGATEPSSSDLRKAAEALGVHPAWLTWGLGAPTADEARNKRIAKAVAAAVRDERKRRAA